MAGKSKRKASTFTDEERADAVALYLMRGGPKQKGALTKTANYLNIWPNTLRRWENGESNPPPNKIVNRKKGDISETIESMLWDILAEMGLSVSEATFQQLATAFGILFDKLQLLRGGPTENINPRVLVLDFGDAPNGNGSGRTIPD